MTRPTPQPTTEPAHWRPHDYVEGWLRGWVISRATPPAEPIEGGWRVATGTAYESVRLVLDPDHRDPVGWLARIVGSPQPPRCCVKLAGEPAEWLPRFGAAWVFAGPTWFMLRRLDGPDGPDVASPAPQAPPGYRVELSEPSPAIVAVTVTTETGEPAARGQVALGPTYAVVDRIVTEPDHRRRGLGRVVMGHLDRAARAAGRTRAVLGATADGRALYSRLGWHQGRPEVWAYHEPATADPDPPPGTG